MSNKGYYPETPPLHLSGRGEKIRLNIFIFSIPLIFLSIDSIVIEQTSAISLLGIPLKGLELKHILSFLWLTVLYLVTHFYWVCKVEYKSWKLLLCSEPVIPGVPPNTSQVVSLAAANRLHFSDGLYTWWEGFINRKANELKLTNIEQLDQLVTKELLAILEPDLRRIEKIEKEYQGHLKSSGWRLLVMEAIIPFGFGCIAIIFGAMKLSHITS